MNHLSITLVDASNDMGQSYKAVEVLIDGVSLIELVRAVELPFAQQEGCPDIAGGYVWLPWYEFPLSLPDPGPSERVKSMLLGCRCGTSECWPLDARRTFTATQVSWSEFEQPFRDGRHNTLVWNYDALGPFVFERNQYRGETYKVKKPSPQL